MPPQKSQPTRKEPQVLIDWMENVTTIDWSKVKNRGHVTLPRLTRDEHDNTMRDLLFVMTSAFRNYSIQEKPG